VDFLQPELFFKKTMTQIQLQPATTSKKNRAGKAQLKIDMTPLVDLGFLLIAFFIFTTTMGEPYKTDLYMPAGDTVIDNGTVIGKANALTILLAGSDSIYYYHGKWEEASKANQVHITNYNVSTGIGNIIRTKQKKLRTRPGELLLLIKPMESSSYSNLMNALDEVMINNVKKYAIMDVTEAEKNFVQTRTN
jgi:biopolymer transport protein ExbD